MSAVAARVREIVCEYLGVSMDRITSDSDFRTNLEADSLDLVELIMACEDEFGGETTDEEVMHIRTVGDAVSFIENRLRQEGSQ